jgi:xylulokinase
VGIAGLGESGAPLGRDGEALAPVIAWHDPRGAETVARLERAFGPSLALQTGQRPRTVSSVAKLGWLARHGLNVANLRCWLGVAELCLRRLTGAEATEHSFACRTGCYDVAERQWLPDVARAAGVPAGIFPGVLVAGAPMGTVTPEAAAWSGLPAGIPVTLAGHDHLAGAVGAGALPSDLVNSVGTAETVLRRTESLPDLGRAAEVRAAVSVWPGGTGWAVMTGAARAGVVLGRAAAALGHTLQELDRLAAASNQDGGAGGTVDPGEADTLVVALQQHLDAPLPRADPGTVWRALLEALCRRTFEAASRLEVVAGRPSRLLAFGGGSRSRPWMEIKARLSPQPVAVPRIAEAAGRGAALFAGVAAGWWPSVEAAPAPAAGPVRGL